MGNKIINIAPPTKGSVINKATVDQIIFSNDGVQELKERIEKIERRLSILETPDEEKLNKFPALREAYEHYLLVEKLVENE